MNLAFVNTSYRLGGAETVAHDLYVECAKAGHATRLYVAAGKTYPREPGLVPLYPRLLSRIYHTRFHDLTERAAPRAEWTDRRFRTLASGWPDVVHVHNFHGDYASVESLAYVARRKPLVWTFHGHWGITGGCEHPLECTRYEQACGTCPRLGVWPLGNVDDTAQQLAAKARHLADLDVHVIAPSAYLTERIARSRVGRAWDVHHIPNGVSTTTFANTRKSDAAFRRSLGLDPDRPSILVVNRNFFDRQKGFDTTCDALNIAAGEGVRAQVVLAGHGSDSAAARLSPALAPLSVGYVESTPRIAAFFEASDLFLFASPAENFPCAILEAMASGCCIVATPTSGVTEQIEDGRTGVLASGASGTELARALVTAFAYRERWTSMGRAARKAAIDRYSIDVAVRRHLALYDAIQRS
jgi:glycosyltransferase involved in cell wall biosynthesis